MQTTEEIEYVNFTPVMPVMSSDEALRSITAKVEHVDIGFLELDQSETPLADLIRYCDEADHGKTRTMENLLTNKVLYFRDLVEVQCNPDGTYDLNKTLACITPNVIEGVKLSIPYCGDVVLRLTSSVLATDVVVGCFVDGFAEIEPFNKLATMYTNVSLVLDEECSVSILAGHLSSGLLKVASQLTKVGRFTFKDGLVRVVAPS
jgi:hypothetical protein